MSKQIFYLVVLLSYLTHLLLSFLNVLQDPHLSELIDMGYMFVLPERDAHGRRVIFSKGAVFDSSRFTTSDMVRAHIMTFETLLNDEENQIKGFTYVLDEKAVGFRHMERPRDSKYLAGKFKTVNQSVFIYALAVAYFFSHLGPPF